MTAATELTSAFVAALPPGVSAPPAPIEEGLRALFEAGRAAWPGVDLDAEAFVRHLAGHAEADAALPPVALAADLYLACACVHRVPAAVAAFDRQFSQGIVHAVARIDGTPAFVEDARQSILEHVLLAAPGATPRIAEYAGRAPLRAWLRAVAIRTALSMRRGKAAEPHEPIEDRGGEIVGVADPELEYLKSRYKVEFEAAVRAAIGRLSPKDRTLLRAHLVHGSSIDVLAGHYQIGRSTAARWLASAREALREHTRAELEARLGLTGAGMDSLARLIRSRLDMSASGLLAEGEKK